MTPVPFAPTSLGGTACRPPRLLPLVDNQLPRGYRPKPIAEVP